MSRLSSFAVLAVLGAALMIGSSAIAATSGTTPRPARPSHKVPMHPHQLTLGKRPAPRHPSRYHNHVHATFARPTHIHGTFAGPRI